MRRRRLLCTRHGVSFDPSFAGGGQAKQAESDQNYEPLPCGPVGLGDNIYKRHDTRLASDLTANTSVWDQGGSSHRLGRWRTWLAKRLAAEEAHDANGSRLGRIPVGAGLCCDLSQAVRPTHDVGSLLRAEAAGLRPAVEHVGDRDHVAEGHL
jgi:hypothetical protein